MRIIYQTTLQAMDQHQAFLQILNVTSAIELHIREDPIDAAELSQQPQQYVFEQYGCSKDHIENGMAKMVSDETLEPEVFRCFAEWYTYMRRGLMDRGYIAIKHDEE